MTHERTALTPAQAADVIKYYHDGDNRVRREHGGHDKVSRARSALHAALGRHSILPDGEPLLTFSEMTSGLNYEPTIIVPAEQELTPEQECRFASLTEGGGFSYGEAYNRVVSDTR